MNPGTIRQWNQPADPGWHAATRVRLRRRKSAFGFHLIAANSRPETENSLHAQHRHSVPRRRRTALTRGELSERAAVHQRGQWRAGRTDLFADQPVLWRRIADAPGGFGLGGGV